MNGMQPETKLDWLRQQDWLIGWLAFELRMFWRNESIQANFNNQSIQSVSCLQSKQEN